MGTAASGSVPPAPVPSLLQKVAVPSPFTRANLNCPVPLKLTPSAATRPWKLMSWGTCARSAVPFARAKATHRRSERALFMTMFLVTVNWRCWTGEQTTKPAGMKTVSLGAHPVRLEAHRRKTPNTKLQTPKENTKHQAPNTERKQQTQSSKHRKKTPNTKLQTPKENTQHQAPKRDAPP